MARISSQHGEQRHPRALSASTHGARTALQTSPPSVHAMGTQTARACDQVGKARFFILSKKWTFGLNLIFGAKSDAVTMHVHFFWKCWARKVAHPETPSTPVGCTAGCGGATSTISPAGKASDRRLSVRCLRVMPTGFPYQRVTAILCLKSVHLLDNIKIYGYQYHTRGFR